jgi:hypothetical protein
MARVAHAYHELELIRDDLRRGGFVLPATIETLSARSRADSPQIPAVAYCQGTPLRNEIEARDAAGLADATAHAAAAIARRFGSGRVDSKIQAHIVSVTRPGM